MKQKNLKETLKKNKPGKSPDMNSPMFKSIAIWVLIAFTVVMALQFYHYYQNYRQQRSD